MTRGRPTTPLDFLNLLWETKPGEQYILIWALQGKQSRWFQGLQEAADFLKTSLTDVYVGVGLSKQDLGPDHRCLSGDIAGIPGFWADLDIKSVAHPKDLPASIEDALTLIPESLPPTIIIATGNGVQAWWLFKEPWIFESEDDRKEAATLASRFQTLLRYNSSQRGFTFERLSDLARVLRIPGTFNGKDPNDPKRVTVHSFGRRRYNPSELAEYLDDLEVPDEEAEQSAARDWQERFANKPLVLNLSARIPQETIDRWCEADLRFKNTWFRQRHDLNDQSQSGYDMALANFGVAQQLEEQQIVDLIIHHRFVHRQKPRGRIDYFQRTISRAANARSQFADIPQAEAPSMPGTSDSGTVDPIIAKAQIWERVSAIVGIRIYHVVKITGKDPIYRMELEGAKVEFSTVKKLVTQDSFRCAIAAATNFLPPKQKTKGWEELVRMMLSALTEEDGGEEMDLEGRARMYISQYLAETGFIEAIDSQNTQIARKPMIIDGAITVCSNDFQRYVNNATAQNHSIKEIASMLSVVGGRSFRLHRGAADQTRWKLPSSEFEPARYSAHYREDLEHAD
jgi:hypothetical protein